MKSYFLIILITLLTGCKSQLQPFDQVSEKRTFPTQNCPENGLCTIDMLPNSQLLLKKDDLGNNYLSIEKGNNTVFKFVYTKSQIEDIADNFYSEHLYFEIKNADQSLHLKNEALKLVKMTYARFCYCKGQTGYFEVKNGSLDFEHTKNGLNLDAQFTIERIPQIIVHIHEKLIL